MKRILSLHSRKELRSAGFPFISFRILAFLQKCYSQNPPADWLCKSAPLSSILLPFFMHGPEPPACSLGTLFIPVGFIFLIAATVFQGQ